MIVILLTMFCFRFVVFDCCVLSWLFLVVELLLQGPRFNIAAILSAGGYVGLFGGRLGFMVLRVFMGFMGGGGVGGFRAIVGFGLLWTNLG